MLLTRNFKFWCALFVECVVQNLDAGGFELNRGVSIRIQNSSEMTTLLNAFVNYC